MSMFWTENSRLGMFTLLAAIALGGLVLVLSRVVQIKGPAQAASDRPGAGGAEPAGGNAAPLGISRIDGGREQGTALEEQAVLFDPTPLFLPTVRNASQADIGMAVRREPGDSFRPFPPRLVYSDSVFAVAFPDSLAAPSDPVAALETGRTANPYVPLGRIERELAPLGGRLAFVEVIKAASGEKVLDLPLGVESIPAGGDFGMLRSENWRPMELLASLDRAGFTGAPVIVQGSGSDRVDKIVREMLIRQLHLGQRLQIGFYMFRVGP